MLEETPFQEVTDMKTCSPNEYKLTYKAIGPDRKMHQVIFNRNKYMAGYIHNKSHDEDDSYYAPYLIYKIGQKVGVNVHETEVALVLHQNLNKPSYSTSFFESSIVYDNNLDDFEEYKFNDGYSHAAQNVVQAIYFLDNPEANSAKRNEMNGNALKQVIDNYVESNIYFLMTRGNKAKEEYSKSEIDKMKQELIDRALFGLKFGAHGNFDITMINHKNAKLDPYYLSNGNMLSLNVRNEWIEKQLEKNDEEFKKVLDSEYKPQYGLMPNVVMPTSRDVIKYIFDKYPEQAEKSYKKLIKFTKEDFYSELEECTRMSDSHK